MVWEIVVILGGIALAVLVIYLLYSAAFRAFEAVGFTRGQAVALLLGTFVLSFIDIPLFLVDRWLVMINLGGAALPVVLSFWLLSKRPSAIPESLVAVVLATIVTFLIVEPTPEGISAPLSLAFLPAATAAGVSLLAHWRNADYASPIAFIGGSLGAIIGADVLRLPDFLAQTPPGDGVVAVSIGGAGVWDMVFLSGIVAVALDVVFFHRVRKERRDNLPWTEPDVFTSSTPPEVIRDWSVPSEARERVREAARAITVRQPTTRQPTQPIRGLSGQEIPPGRR